MLPLFILDSPSLDAIWHILRSALKIQKLNNKEDNAGHTRRQPFLDSQAIALERILMIVFVVITETELSRPAA